MEVAGSFLLKEVNFMHVARALGLVKEDRTEVEERVDTRIELPGVEKKLQASSFRN